MTDQVVIGVDVGTYETKGVAVDAQGQVIARAARAHRLSVPRPGWAEHDADDVWWSGTVAVIQELLATDLVDPGAISAVGCSGIGPCVLPVDAAGSPLRPAILYGVDTRATSQIAAMERTLGTQQITERSGNVLSAQSAGPKIAWLRDNEPDVYRRAACFVTSQTYLVGRLTGRWVIDHGTAGYFHPFYDLHDGVWNVAGCEDVVTPDRLPDIAWAYEVAGHVTPEAARETGLPSGVPVITGTTDAPAEAISCGVTEPGRMMLMYGSSIFVIEMLDRAIPSDTLYSAPYVFPGSYVLAGGTATAGSLTQWFLRVLDPAAAEETRAASFEQLAAEAADSPPGARGLVLLPYFSGERTPINDPDACGTVLGLTLSHTRGDLYRAILEGIACGIRAIVETYAAQGAAPTVIRAVGGGTRNDVWTRAVSDISGQRQEIAAGSGASFGDAALAAYGVGLLEDRQAIERWVRVERTVEPDRTLRSTYDDLYRRSTDLYQSTRHLMHDIARGEST
ncbi:carbohydrate kinase [Actinobacteria bacterium YIM 96077]|uniref:Carbohydrate kinase n=1 Tax=Phytoactinopolyspora halophila TaxID=1981511 RepID=A0A329QN97_9ACTN|nr:FGGY-family carbohydrate kinase [Phytoactinopolyspora halophila]AYY12256.1 carbohydrate kinase [Actinobacteria bacterium YIM 96077]RAW13827.1 carbohydrate kinase [Phytoactinopolyspora halophila]